MQEKTSKELIKQSIKEIAISARFGIEAGEFTQEEVGDFIREFGNKEVNRVVEMPEASFILYTLARLAEMQSELMERG